MNYHIRRTLFNTILYLCIILIFRTIVVSPSYHLKNATNKFFSMSYSFNIHEPFACKVRLKETKTRLVEQIRFFFHIIWMPFRACCHKLPINKTLYLRLGGKILHTFEKLIINPKSKKIVFVSSEIIRPIKSLSTMMCCYLRFAIKHEFGRLLLGSIWTIGQTWV